MVWVNRNYYGVWLWMLLMLHTLYFAEPQRDGFISIDCGATANSTDPETGIEWTTDEYYISTGRNRVITSTPINFINVPQLQTLRHFPEKRNKDCYTLPTTQNSSYLLRAVVFFGDFQIISTSYEFFFSIDSTLVNSLYWEASYVHISWLYEYIVASKGDHISFCLLPGSGQPLISTLELRPLAEGMYDDVFRGRYLKMYSRENFGAQPDNRPLRYPDDLYDRLWFSPASTVQIDKVNSSASVSVPNGIFDRPPMKVMQDAFINNTDANSSVVWVAGGTTSSSVTFYVNFFFAELGTNDDSINGPRVIDIIVNGTVFKSNLTVSKETQQVCVKRLKLPVDWATKFEFYRQPGSRGGGPIVNAGEIYISNPVHTSKTDNRDVAALEAVKSNLGLSSWTGDPCLPVPYNWLICGEGETPRVIQITLSKMNLVGTIPAKIAELTALTDLRLDNNKISGGIPDLSAIVDLKTLHLQNNALSGGIPTTLASLAFLTELFLSNNKLSGPIPADLANREGLTFQTSGNERLCAPTENCPTLPVGNFSFVENRNATATGSGVNAGLIGGVVGGGVVVIVVAFLLWIKCRQRSMMPPPPKSPPEYNVNSHLLEATEGFKKCIGTGGYGPVFYGVLHGKSEIAVKRNSGTSTQGTAEFINEYIDKYLSGGCSAAHVQCHSLEGRNSYAWLYDDGSQAKDD